MTIDCKKAFKAILASLYTICSGCAAPVSACLVPAPLQSAAGPASLRLEVSAETQNAIVFADDSLRLYLLANGVSADSQGQISAAAAAQIKALDLGYKADLGLITDLSGLEFFTALEKLNLQGHSMVQADLSAHLNLLELNLSDNVELKAVLLPDRTALRVLNLNSCCALQRIVFFKGCLRERLALSERGSCLEPVCLSGAPWLAELGLDGCKNIVGIDLSKNLRLPLLSLRYMPKKLKIIISSQQKADMDAGRLQNYKGLNNIDWIEK